MLHPFYMSIPTLTSTLMIRGYVFIKQVSNEKITTDTRTLKDVSAIFKKSGEDSAPKKYAGGCELIK